MNDSVCSLFGGIGNGSRMADMCSGYDQRRHLQAIDQKVNFKRAGRNQNT